MLDSFVFSLNTTLPVFVVIVVGMILKRVGLFSETYASLTDKYVFKAALPVLLFKDISQMNFRDDFDWNFVAFCFVVSLIMFLAVWLASFVALKDKSMVGAFAQGAARGSAAILGVALATNIYGTTGLAPLMILSVVPVFNIMSVVILAFSAAGKENKLSVSVILKNIVTNPIILGILIGIPFALFEIPLPAFASGAVNSISATATPMALLAIGASFNLAAAKKKLGVALAASMVKLFLLPAIFLPVAIAYGFRDSALVAIFVMLGSPTTVTCYIMSKNMDNDHVLSSNIIMLSTLLSSVSVTFWVFFLKHASLI